VSRGKKALSYSRETYQAGKRTEQSSTGPNSGAAEFRIAYSPQSDEFKKALDSFGKAFHASRQLSRVPLDQTLAQQNSE
jgi:hypothetical protein